MNARVAQILTCLYPAAWRLRYGEEFQVFLEANPFTLRAVLNVIGWALYQRVSSFGEHKMNKLQHSLVLIVYAYLAAVAGSVNLFWTVDDTPLVDAMHAHAALSSSWALIAACSLLALAALIAAGLPIYLAMIRFTYTARRRDIFILLAFPLCAGAVLLIWIVAALAWTGGHWAPLPWAVTGDWTAPSGWPPLNVRWVLGSITLVLLTAGLVGSGISFKQAIRRCEFPEQRFDLFGQTWAIRPLYLARVPVLFVAGSIVVMALGVAGWGVLADKYAAIAFHARFGGLLNTSTFVSWIISVTLFAAAAAMALRSARWVTTPQAE